MAIRRQHLICRLIAFYSPRKSQLVLRAPAIIVTSCCNGEIRSAKSSTRYHLVPSGILSPESDLEVGTLGEAEISDIELSALLVDRAFAWSREHGQYSLGFGSPGEWHKLADRAEWGFVALGRPVSHCLRVGLPFWLTADGAGDDASTIGGSSTPHRTLMLSTESRVAAP